MAVRQRSPRRPAQRPEQILDTAEHLLADGAGDLNMDLVAETAGLSKGTLYHYFAAKSDVLDALRRRYLDRSVGRALTEAAAASGTMRRLERFIHELLDDANANAALVWALFHDTGTTGNPHLAIVSDALHGLIQQGIDDGNLAIRDAGTVASFFAHGFFGRIQDAFHRSDVRPAELAAELTGLLERLVTPVKPEPPQRRRATPSR